jgi:hypothetical protein
VRDLDASGAFVVFAEPLPVGTVLSLKIGEGFRDARVGEVIESADAAAAGMRVVFTSAPPAGEVEAVPEEVVGQGSASGAQASQPVAADGQADGGGRRRRKRR